MRKPNKSSLVLSKQQVRPLTAMELDKVVGGREELPHLCAPKDPIKSGCP